MRQSSQELSNKLTKLRSELEELRKRALELETDGKSIDSAGKPVTREAREVLLRFHSTREQIKTAEGILKYTIQLESLKKGDSIQIAKDKAKLNDTLQKATDKKAALETLGKAGTTEWNNANKIVNEATGRLKSLTNPSEALNQLKELSPIKELPIQPDPELIKREAIARAQKLKADAELLLQQRKEEELDKVRSKVELASSVLGKAVGLYLKLPTIDPKFIAFTAYKQAMKKLRDLKQSASMENLKKSKEAFTFPMKPPARLDLGQLPKIKPPTIPRIPTNLPLLNQKPITTNNNPQAQPDFVQPTAPDRSKFTFSVDGGGDTSFELIEVFYEGRVLNIKDWPINTTFSPSYGYSSNGKVYTDGIESVRARIQDSILRGDFDRYVSAPF
jgi:Fe-S-cluster formation regulator IscX/YfhJ